MSQIYRMSSYKLINLQQILSLSLAFTFLCVAPTVYSQNTIAVDNRSGAEPATYAEYYSKHHLSNEQQKVFIDNENRKTNLDLKKSKNRVQIQNYFSSHLDIEKRRQMVRLSNGDQLVLRDLGLGKATRLIYVAASTATTNTTSVITGETILSSNLEVKKNNSIAYINFIVSPDEKYVALFSESNGSIDDYQITLFSLTDLKKIETPKLVAKNNILFWTSNSQFIYTNPENFQMRLLYDIPTKTITPVMGLRYLTSAPNPILCQKNSLYLEQTRQDVSNNNIATTQKFSLNFFPCNKILNIIRANAQVVDLVTTEDNYSIIRFIWDEKSQSYLQKKLFQFTGKPRLIKHIDGQFFIYSTYGKQQSLLIVDDNGQLKNNITIPNYISIMSFARKIKNQSIEMSLNSPIVSDIKTEFNYAQMTWNLNQTQAEALSESIFLKKDNIQYENKTLEIPTENAQVIYTRMTYKKDLSLNKNTPMLIHVYGAFDKPGKFMASFDPAVRDLFLRKGGVFVAPAVRGGDELGDDWNQQGTGLNKINTFHDMISVAKYLVNQQWTSPGRIITTGTSAGGTNVMASALLSPESFGLVIPVSGVFNILGRYELDPRFASSWKAEYGDPNQPEVRNYIQSYSPLEQTLKPESMPQIYLMNGLYDSRVNALHSIQMMQKFRQYPALNDKVRATFLKNSGHWVALDSYQDYIAWRENILVWTRIYDFLKW